MAPRIAWLGDDFTGAAAVLEVLEFGGVPAVLFLEPPTPERLAALPLDTCIGLATMARTRDPVWMDAHLPDLFAHLGETGAEIIHYKVCSTLDSAPHTGSIGRAMDIGARHFASTHIPIVMAAPALRRYQAFGTLFAGAADGDVHRLDRHPVMARHPVTPMREADVARHLAAQTEMVMGCLNREGLTSGVFPAGVVGVTVDMMDAKDEAAVGRLIWQGRTANRFVVGSQGIEYALLRHWQETGDIKAPALVASLGRCNRMAIVSGSVSPTTAAQIGWARDNGFAVIGFDTGAVVGNADTLTQAINDAIDEGAAALEHGQIPLIHSAEGPGDDRVAALSRAVRDADRPAINDRIGQALGQILRTLVDRAGLRRVVASGGDTTGHVCQALDLYALTALAPTIPGAAICLGHSDGPTDGLQIAPKGGQMGSADFFGWVRDGGGLR